MQTVVEYEQHCRMVTWGHGVHPLALGSHWCLSSMGLHGDGSLHRWASRLRLVYDQLHLLVSVDLLISWVVCWWVEYECRLRCGDLILVVEIHLCVCCLMHPLCYFQSLFCIEMTNKIIYFLVIGRLRESRIFEAKSKIASCKKQGKKREYFQVIHFTCSCIKAY